MAELFSRLDDEFGFQLHADLLAGSKTASSRICENYLAPVVSFLKARYRHEPDSHLLEDAAITALMNYLQRPSTYNPEAKPLFAFLKMAADKDFLNLLKSETRRTSHFAEPPRNVADPYDDAERESEFSNGRTTEDEVIEIIGLDPSILAEIERLLPDPVEREALWMMCERERRNEPYAILLGITHLPEETQVREVKKLKDRIRVKLKRNLDPAGLHNDD